METIFWAYITTNKSGHDRRQYFKQQKTLFDFYKWLEIQVNNIEDKAMSHAVVENMGVIEKKF